MSPAKSVYAVATWTHLVALVSEHATLRAVVTRGTHDVPSVYAGYRFAVNLQPPVRCGSLCARAPVNPWR
jgi:hypothetical protein